METDKKIDVKDYLQRGEETRTKEEDTVQHIPLTLFEPNPFQPRKFFDQAAMKELAESIREKGVLQPITARKIEDLEKGAIYQIATGERRLEASKIAGEHTIPTIVKNLSDQDMAADGLIENLQRENLIFIEEMESYAQLRELYGNVEIVASKVGKNQKTVYRYLKIHTALHSIPEIAEIILDKKHNKRLPSINYKTGEQFLEIAADVKNLNDPISKKKNTREFERILKNFREEENTGKYILKINKKFKKLKSKTTEAPNEAPPSPVFFTDSEKALSLTILIKKNEVPLSPERHASIKEAVDTFFSKLDAMTIVEVGTHEA
jgi:ParB family chromosome partitioning protein